MTPLAKKYDVAAFDLRGSGDSAPPVNGDYSYGGRAAHICAVADAYQMERLVLVANSAGAAVALQYAALNATRVAGLLMVDPATDNAGALYRLVPTIPHEVVRTEGHWLQIDHPDVVQKAIETFLVEVAAKPTVLAAVASCP